MSDFEPITLPYAAQFKPLDLGEFAPEYAGRSLQVMANPSVRFRREFIASCYTSPVIDAENAWLRGVAAILGAVTFDAVSEALDGLPLEVMRWLFLPVSVPDPNVGEKWEHYPPFVVRFWDRLSSERVKAAATR